LSQENQSCLRFSLEESLWFRKGQEVEELISISLDPDITIQENDQYVTIRGSLQLTGEYKSYETNNENEDEGFTSQKFVERVDDREGGTCEFSHRFPVDITIPNNRIQSIYDIDVLVESFDYSTPERSCLKLAAELTISGLYGTEQQKQQQQEQPEEIVVEEQPEVVAELEVLHRSETDNFDEEAEEVEVELTSVQSNYQDNFLFDVEARKPQKEESVEILPKFPTFNYQPQEEVEEEESYQPTWIFQEARSEASQPEEAPVEAVIEEAPAPIPAPTAEFQEEVMTAEESSSSPEEPPAKNIKKKKAAKKKSMTLTEFFARKDESSEHAKVRVCIVQKGDTVNTVADRYDVTVQNLLRVNNLEINQDIFEGQVLYIPGTLAKK
jgi:stage VI sporulation protein D